ncbi:MAG: hypothetical protein KatS3mg105_4096 [Gemmatales bacterium]|nr:MAG: hypothetical protein KatS3mg105_4096 [Gemmatales bacterium]
MVARPTMVQSWPLPNGEQPGVVFYWRPSHDDDGVVIMSSDRRAEDVYPRATTCDVDFNRAIEFVLANGLNLECKDRTLRAVGEDDGIARLQSKVRFLPVETSIDMRMRLRNGGRHHKCSPYKRRHAAGSKTIRESCPKPGPPSSL